MDNNPSNQDDGSYDDRFRNDRFGTNPDIDCNERDPVKIVKSLAVETKPQDYYVSGDTFNPEGEIPGDLRRWYNRTKPMNSTF